MNRIIRSLALLTVLATSLVAQTKITQLIDALRKEPWPGAVNNSNPTLWLFRFTAPMDSLLKIGPVAQKTLLRRISDPEIADQIIILLGGVGDERSVGPIIQAMTRASSEPAGIRRARIMNAGNLALTNITVADVIWHHGGGIKVDACPTDPAGCWARWWQQHKTFRVSKITQSRRYSNYPNYGIYRNLP